MSPPLPLPTPRQLLRAACELRVRRTEWGRRAHLADEASDPGLAMENRVFADDMDQVADWLDEQASRTEVL
jgi:hypothetical protein